MLYSAYRKLALIFAAPVYLSFFFDHEVGRDYGVGFVDKVRLVWRFYRNNHSIQSASFWGEHLLMAAELLKLPRSVPGTVVECGTFKGGSAANLSLICAIVGRRLIVCDSFEGLPEPKADDKVHAEDINNWSYPYEKGMYAGGLEEVRSNISRCGDISVCEFVKGFFDTSLIRVNGPIAFLFLDVDLHDSLKSCLTALWPKLNPGGHLFSHEATDLEYVALFFDKPWWRANLNTDAPGFIGAGTGLPTRIGSGSYTGYTVKRAVTA